MTPGSRLGRFGILLGIAALILAAAILIVIRRRTAVAPESPVAPTAVATVAASFPTAAPLPTRGPREAADASVGAPRMGGDRRETGPTASGLGARAEPPPAAPEPPEAALSHAPPAVKVVQTRRFAKFSVSPDQARIFLDGRYVGVADDWDDHGGGKTLELVRDGTHRVRLELPGYRTINLEIVAKPDASEETVDIGDDLKRESKVDFPKIPKLDDRTVGPVEFLVDPPDAQVSEGRRVFGAASSFGPGSPLRLSGPMAHDLTLSAPGRRTKKIRILVASNAEREVAKVKVELKRE